MKKVKQRDCLCCGREVKRKPNIYCSNQCQQRHQVLDRYKNDPNSVGPKALRTYLIHTRGAICEGCGLTLWLDKPIPLEIDHIDGNSEDNRDQNIRLLCPNCHAQTETYKGRNRGYGRLARRKDKPA